MKKLLLLLITVSLLFSCEKEPDDEPENNVYRIKQMVFDVDDVGSTMIVNFSYENEKLVIIDYYINENGVSEKVCTSDFVYSGNNVSQFFTYHTELAWDYIEQMDYVIENNLMLEISNSKLYDILWGEDGSKTFQYSDNRLISDKLFDHYNPSEQIGKTDYTYENNNLTELKKWYIDEEGIWKEIGREEFTYSDNKISYIEQFYNSPIGWEPIHKKKYNYTGDKLNKVEFYFWDSNSNSWVYDDSYYSFIYNDEGYLIETSDSGEAFVTYEYEIGKGNVDTFTSPDISLYKFPSQLGIFYMPF